MGGSKSRQQGKSLVTGQDGNRNKMQELESERESSESLNSVIVGAGFAGLYKLYRLRSNNANERTMTNKYSPTLTPHLTLLKFCFALFRALEAHLILRPQDSFRRKVWSPSSNQSRLARTAGC
jgi:hypothetical protein